MQKLQLNKRYKSGSALEIIRDAILAGDISGEISQNEFADSLEVSRIPVREALIALEYQGLIEKLPNQHARIINLDSENIRNLFADMSLLELETVKSLPAEKIMPTCISGKHCIFSQKYSLIITEDISQNHNRDVHYIYP